MTEKKTAPARKNTAKKKKVTFITNVKYGVNLYCVGDELEVSDAEFKELHDARVIRDSEW